jgi:hypothetical protein
LSPPLNRPLLFIRHGKQREREVFFSRQTPRPSSPDFPEQSANRASPSLIDNVYVKVKTFPQVAAGLPTPAKQRGKIFFFPFDG